jgi:hypothetical protein
MVGKVMGKDVLRCRRNGGEKRVDAVKEVDNSKRNKKRMGKKEKKPRGMKESDRCLDGEKEIFDNTCGESDCLIGLGERSHGECRLRGM